MNCSIKKVLLVGFAGVFFSSAAIAGKPTQKEKSKTQLSIKKVEASTQALLVDAIDVKPALLPKIKKLELEEEINKESELYPADDLYGSWNNSRVNPYASIELPDSFSIDVSKYIPPTEGYVTSNYGPRRRRFHYGIDLKVQVGDTIRAAFDGKVRVKDYERKGYGYYLVLRHDNGLETVYGHLSEFLVEEETIVKAGEPIALGGNTGRSTGSHLHFETRFLGKAINPAEIFDFQNYVAHKDVYVFNKDKSNSVINKYTSKGDSRMVYHRIQKGDTLGKIARKYGVSVNTLCRLNNIKSTKTLRVGSSIRCS